MYSRGYGNPTVDAFQSAMADLEESESAIGFASGMAAISTLFLTVASSGSRIVAGTALYGGSVSMLRHVLPRFGIETTFVDPTDLDQVRDALPGADLFYCETIVNPTTTVPDLAALAGLCRDAGVLSRRRQHVRVPVPVQPGRPRVRRRPCTPRRSTSAGTPT